MNNKYALIGINDDEIKGIIFAFSCNTNRAYYDNVHFVSYFKRVYVLNVNNAKDTVLYRKV